MGRRERLGRRDAEGETDDRVAACSARKPRSEQRVSAPSYAEIESDIRAMIRAYARRDGKRIAAEGDGNGERFSVAREPRTDRLERPRGSDLTGELRLRAGGEVAAPPQSSQGVAGKTDNVDRFGQVDRPRLRGPPDHRHRVPASVFRPHGPLAGHRARRRLPDRVVQRYRERRLSLLALEQGGAV